MGACQMTRRPTCGSTHPPRWARCSASRSTRSWLWSTKDGSGACVSARPRAGGSTPRASGTTSTTRPRRLGAWRSGVSPRPPASPSCGAAPRRALVVHREVEMVGTGAIDRAGEDPPRDQVHGDPRPAAHEVAQHEAEGEPFGQGRSRRRRARGAQEVGVREADGPHRGERHDHRTPRSVGEGQSDPVRAHAGHRRSHRRTIGEVERRHGRRRSLAGGEQRQTLGQLHPREPQALGLGVERGTLGLPFGGELILEVVEEAVPAHSVRVGHRGPSAGELSTADQAGFS